MSRRALTGSLVLSAMIGAALTVAVAWWCALRVDSLKADLVVVDQTDQRAAPADELQRLRAHPVAQSYSDAEVWLGMERGIGLERRAAFVMQYWEAAAARSRSQPTRTALRGDIELRIRAGWPMLALQGERELDAQRWWTLSGTMAPLEDLHRLHGLLAVETRWPREPQRRLLPLKPLWPGFAFNALLYGGLAWLAIFGPRALRRSLRRRRGLCPHCAYPRGEGGVCTECGMTNDD